MNIGYARVSRQDQNPQLQIDALQAAGCERIFEEKQSGAKFDRPEFLHMLDIARADDKIVVWKLDRLGRSLKDLITVVNDLEERGIELQCTAMQIDTSTAGGKLMFHIFAALAQFEREMIIERTKAGLEAARARGRRGGQKKASEAIPPKVFERARQLYEAKSNTVEEICDLTGLSKSTFYRYVVHGGEAK